MRINDGKLLLVILAVVVLMAVIVLVVCVVCGLFVAFEVAAKVVIEVMEVELFAILVAVVDVIVASAVVVVMAMDLKLLKRQNWSRNCTWLSAVPLTPVEVLVVGKVMSGSGRCLFFTRILIYKSTKIEKYKITIHSAFPNHPKTPPNHARTSQNHAFGTYLLY